ncbi:MAG: hypothetical protein II727_04180 [Oscillospiraceae bacterium]|nr:hypothetical protein [Oscillospiraceae bacterium]
MKKFTALLLSALLLAGLFAGCAAKPEENTESDLPESVTAPVEPAPETEPAEEEPEEEKETVFSAEGSVLFEKDGVKVTSVGLDDDPTDEAYTPIIWVDIENASDQDVTIGVDNGSVNGVMAQMLLVNFYEEDGEYYGASYDFSQTVEAGNTGRYALGYYMNAAPGIKMDTLEEMELSFTLAEDESTWPDYVSEPVRIVIDGSFEAVDIASLGQVVIDNEQLRVVVGEQDYEDWFGPIIYIYAENKTDRHVGLTVESAEADAAESDYVYYASAIAPGKISADQVAFEGDIRELRGFENLTLNMKYSEADTKDDLDMYSGTMLDPVYVQYPPQVWGEYENGGLSMEITPKYNNLVTVETPENDENGILFTVSETASLEAGGYEGAGWLFSIGTMDEEKLHETLCRDMSGMGVFASDADGRYYIFYTPTDVRMERASSEEMQAGFEQWSMLCSWAENMVDSFRELNALEYEVFGNSEINMYFARAAYQDGVKAEIDNEEFGTLDAMSVDAKPYAEFVVNGLFYPVEEDEDPDGECYVVYFPDDDVRFEFFNTEDGYVRMVSGDFETLFQAAWYEDGLSYAGAMKGWYYAAAEKAGMKALDERLDQFLGVWYESVAGRAEVVIEWTPVPGRVKIRASWPESAAVRDFWEMVGVLDDGGQLVYEDGSWEQIEFDENGESYTTDSRWGENGWFYINGEGNLCWHDAVQDYDEDSVFIK